MTLLLLKKLLFEKEFRKAIKMFKISTPIYAFFAFEILKKAGAIPFLKEGISLKRLMHAREIKNKKMLEHILDFLVGQRVLELKKGKYFFLQNPPEINKKNYSFLEKHFPASVKWAETLRKKALRTLKTGKSVMHTGFSSKKFLKLWDAIMHEAPNPLRGYAVDKFVSKINDGARILDYGCGSGVGLELILKRCKKKIFLEGMEPSKKYLNIAKQNLYKLRRETKSSLIKENALKTKLINSITLPKKEYYDVVFLSLVLNHVKPAERLVLFKKIFSILKPKGILVIFQLTHASKFERNPIFLMHVIPSHKDYPYRETLFKELSTVFSSVKMYLNGTVFIAEKI